jgi:hypothetical protein
LRWEEPDCLVVLAGLAIPERLAKFRVAEIGGEPSARDGMMRNKSIAAIGGEQRDMDDGSKILTAIVVTAIVTALGMQYISHRTVERAVAEEYARGSERYESLREEARSVLQTSYAVACISEDRDDWYAENGEMANLYGIDYVVTDRVYNQCQREGRKLAREEI